MDQCNRKLMGPFLSIHQIVDEYEKTIENLTAELRNESQKRLASEDKASKLEEQVGKKDEQLEKSDETMVEMKDKAAKDIAEKDEELVSLNAKVKQLEDDLSVAKVQVAPAAPVMLPPQQYQYQLQPQQGIPQQGAPQHIPQQCAPQHPQHFTQMMQQPALQQPGIYTSAAPTTQTTISALPPNYQTRASIPQAGPHQQPTQLQQPPTQLQQPPTQLQQHPQR